MKYRKFWTLAFCVGLNCGASAQPAPDDQSRALDALRQAESTPAPAATVKKKEMAPMAEAPAPAMPATSSDSDAALQALRQAESAPPPAPAAPPPPAAVPMTPVAAAAPAAPVAPMAPEAAPAPAPNDPDTDAALQALRQAETAPAQPMQNSPAMAPMAPAAAAMPATPMPATPMSAPESATSGDPALDALRQQEAQPGMTREQRDAQIRAAKLEAMRKKLGERHVNEPKPMELPQPSVPEQPKDTTTAAPMAPAPEPAPAQNDAALQALRQAESAPPAMPVASTPPMAMSRPAPSMPPISGNNNAPVEAAALESAMSNDVPHQSAADPAMTRDKAQTEVARRVASLPEPAPANPVAQAPSGAAPNVPMTPAAPAMTTREQKLADLLRRYQADEITPVEYHTQRARIIAEP